MAFLLLLNEFFRNEGMALSRYLGLYTARNEKSTAKRNFSAPIFASSGSNR
jgi:hypothetical protein